jgi:hypothetical protein
MRNHPNIPANNIADKRFEALVKKEMIEHQHIISSHHKEMQGLRETLSLSMEKAISLSERNEMELQEFTNETTNQITRLKERLKADEALILEQRKMIEDMHQQLLGLYILLASKSDVEKLKKEIEVKIDYGTMNHLNSLQNFQSEIKILVQSLKNDQVKFNLEIESKLSGLSEIGENNFSCSQIDKEGVLREIRTYKKDMFYIEKKIENIYTLIERLNKRVEICPKPV